VFVRRPIKHDAASPSAKKIWGREKLRQPGSHSPQVSVKTPEAILPNFLKIGMFLNTAKIAAWNKNAIWRFS
jgi:hypothetical protein